MKNRFTADFETTVDVDDCRVWAYSICTIGAPDEFEYGNSIDGFFEWMTKNTGSDVYFHNLKFDGEFIFNHLFRQGFRHVKDRKDLETKTFTTLISDTGQFYSIEICFAKKGENRKKVKILDSLKILPFSVAEIAKGFKLPILKLEIDYAAPREPGHILTPEEIAYIRNDVEIMSRALDILFRQDLRKMTQGSNALYDYKKTIGEKRFSYWYPIPDYDSDIRQAYKGGFTFCNPKFQNQDLGEGIVLDVNSLYPSVMHDRPLPYGEGRFFKGKYKPDKNFPLFVQMIRCAFELKPGFIPTVQLKNSLAFIPTEYLRSSGGDEVAMCMTSVDLELFLAHYEVYNLEYFSGWKFRASTEMFKPYIDKWMQVKIQSTIDGNKAMRTLAKLMLNALYGKFALNPRVCSKTPYLDPAGVVRYHTEDPEQRDPIYIPVGVFVTAWARYKTITSAQSVFDRFVYADTDSLHLVGSEIPENLEIDPVKLGAWKHESTFTRARFLRQKSYIEEIDGVLHVTCAGMPESCKADATWDNFRIGGSFGGKLTSKHVPGGIVLVETPFTIKNH